jgi:hypothetical protein
MKTREVTYDATDRVVGSRPVHIHRCPGDAKEPSHEWACNSPYCEDLVAPCPELHGGNEPVVQGREPWRGGNR